MLVIWRGWGWIVIVIVAASFLGTEWAVEAFTGDGRYYQEHDWTKTAAAAAACFITMAVGFYLNHARRLQRDEASGEVTAMYPAHTLYYIPIEYWSLIIVVFFGGVHLLMDRQIDGLDQPSAAEYRQDRSEHPYGKPMTRDELEALLEKK